jgi:hypothetical protein
VYIYLDRISRSLANLRAVARKDAPHEAEAAS